VVGERSAPGTWKVLAKLHCCPQRATALLAASSPFTHRGAAHLRLKGLIGAAGWKRVQCHVMRLREGGDPVVADDWEPPRPVLQADGSPLQLDAEHSALSLDMTYFEDAGRSYVVWSQRYITDLVGDAELRIATIDPPTRGD
jgi:hypothetical protein